MEEQLILFRRAEQKDAELLISLYNASFYEDFVRYGECPAYGRTKERMEDSIARFPKEIIYYDNTPVGVLSFERRESGVVYLGCLCLIPAFQGRGIGARAFFRLFELNPDAARIELITPADKRSNILFYTKKCGCCLGSRRMDGNVEVVEIYREK